jgi:hypothetical protein
METPKTSTGLAKAGKVLGIIGLILALLPLLSGWFLLLTWLSYVLGAIGLVLAIIAFVKKQNGAIIGIVLCAASIVLPICLKNTYAEKAAESAANAIESSANMLKGVRDMTESLDSFEESTDEE